MNAPEPVKSNDQNHLQLPVPLLDLAASDPGLFKLTRDLAALKRENAALRRQVARLNGFKKLSLTDPLTGLHNRRYFEHRIVEELSRAARTEQDLSLLVVDLDDFKQINDVYGHARGDVALRWVAEFLRDNTRCHDVCCRLGGDEFVVILAGADAEECGLLVERLQERFEATREATALPLRWSVGTATYGEGCTTAEALFDRADAAMYHEKQRRKQRRRLPAV
jgi:diguanylate cyclase (GGDEF)-like protein